MQPSNLNEKDLHLVIAKCHEMLGMGWRNIETNDLQRLADLVHKLCADAGMSDFSIDTRPKG